MIKRNERLPRKFEHLLLADSLLQCFQHRRVHPKGSMHIRSMVNAGVDNVLDFLSICDLRSETSSVSFLVGRNDSKSSCNMLKKKSCFCEKKKYFQIQNSSFSLDHPVINAEVTVTDAVTQWSIYAKDFLSLISSVLVSVIRSTTWMKILAKAKQQKLF